jgi:hypothetical protein
LASSEEIINKMIIKQNDINPENFEEYIVEFLKTNEFGTENKSTNLKMLLKFEKATI